MLCKYTLFIISANYFQEIFPSCECPNGSENGPFYCHLGYAASFEKLRYLPKLIFYSLKPVIQNKRYELGTYICDIVLDIVILSLSFHYMNIYEVNSTNHLERSTMYLSNVYIFLGSKRLPDLNVPYQTSDSYKSHRQVSHLFSTTILRERYQR